MMFEYFQRLSGQTILLQETIERTAAGATIQPNDNFLVSCHASSAGGGEQRGIAKLTCGVCTWEEPEPKAILVGGIAIDGERSWPVS